LHPFIFINLAIDLLLKSLFILPEPFLVLKTIPNLPDSGPNSGLLVASMLDLFELFQNYALRYRYGVTCINTGNYKDGTLYYYLI
jgi:hypothetical protein